MVLRCREEGRGAVGRMLRAEGASRARALRLEQEAGQWGAGMWAASLEGDSIRAQFGGRLQGELELHELFPMLCLPRLVFSGCPHVPPALSQWQL